MATKYLRGQSIRISKKEPDESSVTLLTMETSCNIALNTNLEDDSTKDDSEGWDKQIVSSRSWTMSADVRSQSNGENIAKLLKNWIDGGTVSITAQTSTTSSSSYSGSAILTQLDIDATVKQNVSASVTWTGVGAIA